MESCSVTFRGTMMIFGGSMNSKAVAIVKNGQNKDCGLIVSSLKLPVDMYRHSCIVNEEEILLCGSKGRENQCYRMVDYTFERSENMLKGHSNAAMVYLGSDPLIIGGVDTQYTAVVERLYATGSWKLEEDLPFAMEGHSAITTEGKVYVFGGRNKQYKKDILIFDGEGWTLSESKLQHLRAGHRTVFQPYFSGTEEVVHIGGYGIVPYEKWSMVDDNLSVLNSTSSLDNYFFYPEVFAVTDFCI